MASSISGQDRELPSSFAHGVVVGGPPVGVLLGLGGRSAPGGVAPQLGPMLNPGLVLGLGLGAAGWVAGG